MSNAVKTLRKALGDSLKFEEGTVVRWKSANELRRIDYRYAALYVATRWYISGGEAYYGKTMFSTEEFLRDVLGGADAGTIEVATGWEQVG